MIGYLCISMAGHDRLQKYVIMNEEKEYVWLCDGKLRPVEKLKKKKKKHIQVIKRRVNEELYARLIEHKEIRNEEIRKVITEDKINGNY